MKVQVATTSHIPNIARVDTLRNRQNADVQQRIKDVRDFMLNKQKWKSGERERESEKENQ